MLDGVVIHVEGGDGGAGSATFHREKFVPLGGPDGGDGGRGGLVLLQAVDDIYWLEQYRSKKKFKASNGGSGDKKLMHGANGTDLVLKVPAGTVVFDNETEDVLADLSAPGQEVVVAYGGRGGWGNKRFANSTNQAPHFAQKGHRGEMVEIRLELRLLADVGLIGLPNAGKSTFLDAVSNAKPKIASYAFTTLEPMLGVVNVGYDRFTLADLPGLVEGASEGYGLGFEFLKHVRRCRVLLHVVDSSSIDPVTDFELIENEVRTYDPRLKEVPRVVAVTKADIEEEFTAMQAADLAKHLGVDVAVISADSGLGIDDLLQKLMALVVTEREKAAEAGALEVPVLRPASPQRFDVKALDDGRFEVIGRRIVSFVEMMDFEQEGARDEVLRRLDRYGISKGLRKAGASEGSRIVFGDVEFTWES